MQIVQKKDIRVPTCYKIMYMMKTLLYTVLWVSHAVILKDPRDHIFTVLRACGRKNNK